MLFYYYNFIDLWFVGLGFPGAQSKKEKETQEK